MSPLGEFPKCLNCGFRMVKTHERITVAVSELEPRERSILKAWIQPRQALDSDMICIACNNKLLAVEETSSEHPPVRQYGHPAVCIVCGCSALKKFKYRLKAVADRPEGIFLREHYTTFLVNNDGRICGACWHRVIRHLDKQNQPVEIGHVAAGGTGVDGKTSSVKGSTNTIVQDNGKNKLKTEIEVEGYSKVVVSEGHRCVACGSIVSVALGLPARRHLLIKRRLYTPSAAPVCETHTEPESWPTTLSKTGNKFTADDIEDMAFVMRYFRAIDLSQPANIDPHARKIWLGVEPDEFETILARNPKLLLEGVTGRLALGVWLAKQKSGECVSVLASLTQRSVQAVDAGLRLAEGAGLGASSEVPN